MATPIETNTEGLREILRLAYNLPSGGSTGPDLVIRPKNGSVSGLNGPTDPNFVEFDQEEVVATYQKLLAGESVDVVFTGIIAFTSANFQESTMLRATMVVADAKNSQLYADFSYINDWNSVAAQLRVYRAIFNVNVASGTATCTWGVARYVGTV